LDKDFLSNINLSNLSSDQLALLDAQITQEEIKNAILAMNTEKSPGTDGFSVQGLFPPSFNEALISLIPKKGRDQTDPANFRSISLINVDSKILAKVLTLRLETILPYSIHTDQVGLIKGRSSTDNLR
uniref:Uncharacterized protein n=1 Tax=Astyanax mexicanus TaxID=7994 RepID=A0A3B1JKZ7_ASTMX